MLGPPTKGPETELFSAKRLQGHSSRRRRDPSVLDANSIQDTIVTAWTESIAAEVTLPEGIMLFCIASDADWQKAGVTHAYDGLRLRKPARAICGDRSPADVSSEARGRLGKSLPLCGGDNPQNAARFVRSVHLRNPGGTRGDHILGGLHGCVGAFLGVDLPEEGNRSIAIQVLIDHLFHLAKSWRPRITSGAGV